MCNPTNAAAKAEVKPSTAEATTVISSEHNNDSNDDSQRPEFRRLGKSCPHRVRREEILLKYPEIQTLYGPDLRLVYWSIVLVVVQVSLVISAPQMNWPTFCLAAWLLGGTFSHSLSLASHEASHNLGFAKPLHNELLGIFCNLGQGFASAVTFKRYHMDHHIYQGHDVRDVDIPSEWEVGIFQSSLSKFLWLTLQPFFYAFRPLLLNPKTVTKIELLNTVVVYGWDLWLVYTFGWSTFGFMCMSLWLGMSLHPVAGHFIAEHYTLNPDSTQETFSYYGPLNMLCFNVGYHNEHHDFPRISGFRLPLVRAMAPEFYDERWKTEQGDAMEYYSSWVQVMYKYVFNPNVGPHSRIKRESKKAV